MDLLFLCFVFFVSGGSNRNPGLKKEKKLKNIVEHVTYVTVDCNSLLELIKIYCFKLKC